MNREDLLSEIESLRRRVAELEETEVRLVNTEKALRYAEARFLAISQHTFEAVFLSEEGLCTGQNLAAEKMFGYTTEEALGRHGTEWIAPEYRELVKKNMLMDHAPPYEVMAVRKDGTSFPCEVQGKSVNFQGRQIRVTALRDITERKKAEGRLKESEELYRELVEGIDDLVCKHDLQGNLLFVSRLSARLLGYSSDEMIGTNLRSYLVPEVRDQFQTYLDDLLRDGRASGLTLVQTKDGERRLWEYSNSVHSDNAGERCVIGIARDVTERNRAKKALQQAEKKYRGLFENAPLMYVITRNEQGVPYISDCNRFFLRTIGYSRNEVIDRPLGDFYSPESKHALLEGGGYARALAGQFLIGERQLLTREGKIVPTLLYTAQEEDADGRVTGTRAMFVDITDRIRAETELRESHDILHRSRSTAFLWKNAEGWPVEFVTDNVVALFGYTAGEFTSGEVPYSMTVHPDDLERVAEEVATCSQEEGRLAFDHEPYRIVTKDGKIKWVDDSTVIRRNEHGEITHFQGIVGDITERVQAKQALQENEHNLLEAQRVAHIGSWVWNLGSDQVVCSKEMLRIWGYLPEKRSLTLAEVMERIHPEDRDRVRKLLKRTVEENVRYEAEFRIALPDGSGRIIYGVGQLERPEQGKPGLVRGSGLDITERKKAEEALEESRERYRQLSDVSREGIAFHEHGVLLDANRQFSKMFGYEPEELTGKQMMPLTVAPESVDLVKNHIKAGFEGTYEITGLRKDGTRFPVEVDARAGELEGRPIRIATFRDLTDRKLLEEQVRLAQKMEAVGTLAGGIAHDFNNLLQIISGYSEMLLVDKEDQSQSNTDLRAIHEAARRGAELVKQLLTFSRKVDTNVEPLNLNDQVIQAERLLYRTIPKMIDIELRLERDLWNVVVDPGQMEQVLLNLAVNAKDAMPDGGKLLLETENIVLDDEYSRTHLDVEPGKYVLLSVSDTGAGMERDVVDRIFEPFFSTKGLGEGTGLGLAMVYGIVQGHNGTIRCYSEPGHGTTFKIYLPATESEEPKDMAVSRDKPAGGTETILVVDDEDPIRDLGERILSGAGYAVLKASDGEEALKVYRARQTEISLVLLDLIMPKMGGTECLEGLLKINPHVKVLVASGFSVNARTQAAVNAGAQGCVNKPFSMNDLLRSVRQVLDTC